jgi:hypothetical protein
VVQETLRCGISTPPMSPWGHEIAFRVGINIGDVIVEPHDIFGDGVNIAARLESIAEPGGICISSSAYDHVRGKVGVEFADMGEQNLKNIDSPVRAYALVRDEPSPVTRAERVRPKPLSPPHLSIVVLPFANLSGDPEQDYFVDGVTDLAIRGPGLFVIVPVIDQVVVWLNQRIQTMPRKRSARTLYP